MRPPEQGFRSRFDGQDRGEEVALRLRKVLYQKENAIGASEKSSGNGVRGGNYAIYRRGVLARDS